MKKKSIVAAISALSLIVSMNTGIGSVFAGERVQSQVLLNSHLLLQMVYLTRLRQSQI